MEDLIPEEEGDNCGVDEDDYRDPEKKPSEGHHLNLKTF